ncbi:hypothetical protein snork62_gp026 [Flavobacterium phage vB_FspS_snork6-2]|uniref:Uncharacterized protein n=8 Tax=Lillamyvirus TaxID=2843418 RepID=A0A6B9LA89_9CAUD|nr:hypothetical protein HWC89_gp25 [Flavobacterium phage vB_FspS_hemulen6-1]YP_009855165.1 hypothetical protein HWC95_gp29 [Flavobacterium phage vB_FspS_sniff9-1]YP_009855238.1 hypothetical protein HWC96_gp28 [Flavobacterium phage vB_FspS_snork6-1]YP_009855377.1 hypothetical protein HWC98_gp22 [Flavobacterium phage vB_FspS_stinky9-1]QHB38856.1 hypothetical protein hemulen62_gp025 [Flavobacterium phage vB_FspS_hemulen6-2]QHB38926.1 hypothetical protein hemulen91_gp025 [Flavobacterium phage vB_F
MCCLSKKRYYICTIIIKQIMKTIIFLSVATIGMSTDNYLVMSGALLICGILIFKNK